MEGRYGQKRQVNTIGGATGIWLATTGEVGKARHEDLGRIVNSKVYVAFGDWNRTQRSRTLVPANARRG